MAELAWHEVPGGFDAGRAYRVRRLKAATEGGWRLEIDRRKPGGDVEEAVSFHRTLSGAKARAAIDETERVKRLRLQLHVGFAIVMAAVWLIQASVAESSAAAYVVWLLLFVVMLRALVNAAAAATDDDGERLTVRFARRIHLDSLLPPLRRRIEADGDERVRVLEPTS